MADSADSPPIPAIRTEADRCMDEIRAVLKRYGMSLHIVAAQIGVTPLAASAAPGSPQVDAGAEDGS